MDYKAPDFPSKWEKNGFSIIKVTGSGEKKDYLRVCDTVVRNSRLFSRLYSKLKIKTARINSESHFRKEYKARLAVQHKELQGFVRFSNGHIAKLEKKILKLQADLKQVKIVRDRCYNTLSGEMGEKKAFARKNAILLSNQALYNNHSRFFTEQLFVRDINNRPRVRAELFLRVIIAFKEQEDKGQISYKEFLILATGMHVKAFKKEDLMNRFGADANLWFTRTLKPMIESGLVIRFERRNLYYITDAGKSRICNIMRAFNTFEMKTYWGGTFDEFKDTKGNLSATGRPEA